MFLLDTDVISVLRKDEGASNLTRWMSAQRMPDLYISVVSIAEVERGIIRQERRNPVFARTLASWLDDVLVLFFDRILPVDLPVAKRWGRLCAVLGHQNDDLIIAATALEHGLTVVTRNVRHFEPTGVPVLNPF